jgi:hypothetical protein
MILCEKGRSEHAPKFSTQSELSWMLTESSSFFLTQALFHPHLSFLQQQDLAELYAPVEPILSDSLVEYFTKTIAKSVWTLRNHSLSANEEELHPNAFFRDFVQGYYLTHFTVRQLQYYQRHRAEFPSFAEFLPYLLAQYVEHKASLLHEIFYGDGQWEYQKYKENTRSQDARIMLQLADNAYAEILPSLELLSGVLSQTSWIERRGPQGAGNRYFQALKEFFAPYREHDAIQFAEALLKRGFTYHIPPTFVLHLSPMPEFVPLHDYDDPGLLQRAGGRHSLEFFRHALKKLAEESHFLEFFDQYRAELTQYLQDTLQDFDAHSVMTHGQ